MMMMAGQIKLILKTIRCTCTKSQHYDSPNFFLVCPTKMVSWSEISMSVLQRKLFADLQRWLVSCYCVIIAQIKWKKNTHTGIYYIHLVLQKWQGYCSGTWKNGTWPGTKGSGEKEECWGKNKNITKGKLNCCCFFFVFKRSGSRSRHRQNVTEIDKHKWQCYMLRLEIRVKLKLFPLFCSDNPLNDLFLVSMILAVPPQHDG